MLHDKIKLCQVDSNTIVVDKIVRKSSLICERQFKVFHDGT